MFIHLFFIDHGKEDRPLDEIVLMARTKVAISHKLVSGLVILGCAALVRCMRNGRSLV